MTTSRLQDISLYELAFSSEQPPQPLQVSPTTFKSMISIIFDLLIDQKIPATIWLKLPRGEVWKAEVERYRKFASAPYSLYLLSSSRDNLAGREESEPKPEEQEEMPLPGTTPLELVGGQELPIPSADYSSVAFLPLSPESQLKREYFLLVLSDDFSGLILAHRPRSIRTRIEAANQQEPTSAILNLSPDEELERKHPLLAISSFESQTICRVLNGIMQATRIGQAYFDPSFDMDELLSSWDALLSLTTIKPLNPYFMSELFNKQIQRQEEVWHSSALYRKQAEVGTTLRMENEELQNSIRLKDEFLKNVGQELRTPLTTMKTALTLLNSSNLKLAQRQRYMDMLSQECDRQSALITSVLELVQLETAEDASPVQPLRLIDVVPGVVSTYQPLAQEKGVMLAYTIPEDLPTVACLNAHLRQVTINLLHNGIKFTPKGGNVWVRAKQQGEYIQLEFRDTGIGIAATEVPKIFERFYRVRTTTSGDDSNGAGLGLSIVQQLLWRCGGSISVKSKPNEGSTFTVLLPIYH